MTHDPLAGTFRITSPVRHRRSSFSDACVTRTPGGPSPSSLGTWVDLERLAARAKAQPDEVEAQRLRVARVALSTPSE